jgi:hypothetical protein
LFAHECCQRFRLRLLWDANQHSGGIIVLDFDRAADYSEAVPGIGFDADVAQEEVEVAAPISLEDMVFEEAGVAACGNLAMGRCGMPGGEATGEFGGFNE